MQRSAFAAGALWILLLSCSTVQPSLDFQLPIHFENFKTFPSPRTYDGPGTVYRVDARRTKYHVTRLQVHTLPGEVALPQTVSTSETTFAALLRYLGVELASFDYSRRIIATVSVTQPQAQTTFDDDVGNAIKLALQTGQLEIKKGYRYFLIRDTIEVSGMTYVLTASGKGGESLDAQLANVARGTSVASSATGSIQRSTSNSQSLVQTFSKPYFILYLEEELLPGGRGLAGQDVIRIKVPAGRTFAREAATTD